jgi:hypothetical protein
MNTTAWVICFTVLMLVLYDIYAVVTWGYEGTISRDILFASLKHPIIAFAAGLLCGHLFWPQR